MSNGSTRRYVRSGAVAGVIATLGFTAIHHVLISDIWFSFAAMAVAGALCGACVGGSFGLLFEAPSLQGWLRYNLSFVAMLVSLGLASIVVFEPITTVAALLEANGPPTELIRRALPMTVLFTVGAVVVFARVFGRSWRHALVLFLTCTLLVVFLGLNVSVLGLVFVPSSAFVLIAEMFVLVAALDLLYAATFFVLERSSLRLGVRPVHAAS